MLFIPIAAILLCVVWTMLVFVLPPYALIMTMVLGPMGTISAMIVMFHLCQRIFALCLKIILFPQLQAVVFDTVLTREGLYDVLFNYNLRNRHKPDTMNIPAFLFKSLLPTIFHEITYLIIVLMPVVGPLIVLIKRAPARSRDGHRRCFELLGWKEEVINDFCARNNLDYIKVGLVLLFLEMIPGFTFFFLFTSNIGMALWMVEDFDRIEKFEDTMRIVRVPEPIALAGEPDVSFSVEANVQENLLIEKKLAEAGVTEIRRRDYLKLPLHTINTKVWTWCPRASSAGKSQG